MRRLGCLSKPKSGRGPLSVESGCFCPFVRGCSPHFLPSMPTPLLLDTELKMAETQGRSVMAEYVFF